MPSRKPECRAPVGDVSRRWRWGLGAVLLAALVACGGGDGEGAAAPALAAPVTKLDGYMLQESPDPRLAQIREVVLAKRSLPAVPVVRLGAVDLPKSTEQDGALQIGATRRVDAAAEVRDLIALLRWQTDAAGGRTAAVRFESTSADAVRLGLQVSQLPPLTVLRVSASDGTEAVEVQSAEVLRTIQRNVDAGVPEHEAHLYWLPTIDSANVTLEIELAPGMDPAALQVSVPRLAHLWATPETAHTLKIGEAASCHVDVTCTSGHEGESAAVARMVFVKGDAVYLCSGALMNDTRSSGTPYFLSANHCLSTQQAASSLETYWFYRSASCRSTTVHSGMQRLRGGANLLYTNAVTDTAFMRLNGQVPNGVTFAGWDATTPTGSGAIKGLHHPRGDLQKVSVGSVVGFANCQDSADGSVRCEEATAQNGTRLIALWSSGTTEQGSSGSPLFSTSKGSPYVVGQLHSGGGVCEATRVGLYGRFDLAFHDGLKTWLAPSDSPAPAPAGRTAVYRFYNEGTGAHFYTNSVAERDFVIARLPEFQYEGPRFQAANQAGPGLSTVYRFYNATTGAHFYTISEPERDFVIDRLPEFKYEGPTWYAQTRAGNNAVAMHRFYNTVRGTHFYTNIPGEVDFVRQRLPEFKYEDVAYYSWSN